MESSFVKQWNEKKHLVEECFSNKAPGSYYDIVLAIANIIDELDENRIVEIDHGLYQGTLVYVIGAGGYQPSDYWAVKVWYGSCSGCDTLESISYSGESLEVKIKDYMTLALHIVQGLKRIDTEV